ncbi:MAG: hypothetical protein ACW97Z_08075 [Candidatus Hodarchaeales archaeon]|jgi:archaellum biogenesis ATPase FlaH
MNDELETSHKIPTGMDIIDNLLGGFFAGHIHSIIGESGVGKSWLCQRVVNSLLEYDQNASVLYSDFSGNIRLKNLKKSLKKTEFMEQVHFYRPSSLLENVIFCKKILDGKLPNISLLILDTVFGSPMQVYELLGRSKKKRERNIFHFMLDLRKIAITKKIPILISHHASSNNIKKIKGEEDRIDPFCTTKSVLQKSGQVSSLKFYVYNQYLGSTTFKLFSE